jgi:hypothetical protein
MANIAAVATSAAISATISQPQHPRVYLDPISAGAAPPPRAFGGKPPPQVFRCVSEASRCRRLRSGSSARLCARRAGGWRDGARGLAGRPGLVGAVWVWRSRGGCAQLRSNKELLGARSPEE